MWDRQGNHRPPHGPNPPSRTHPTIPEKQKGPLRTLCFRAFRPEIFGAGDGIRTHDPNLGKQRIVMLL